MKLRIIAILASVCISTLGADYNRVDPLVETELKKTLFRKSAETKILFIASEPDHPYLSHMYLYESCLLAKCLRQNPGVDAVVTFGWPENEKLLSEADSIAMYSGPVSEYFLADKKAAKQLQEHANAGKGIVGLHWATGALNEHNQVRGNLWFNTLGCIYNEGQSSVMMDYSKVVRLAKDHPVSQGWMDFIVFEEYYLNMKFVEGAVPVVKVEIADGKEEVVAWCYQRPDGGRSYANTLGHYHFNFSNPSFLKMYVNGILWTAKYEIPEAGAKCHVTEADMNLMPEPENYLEQRFQ